MPKIIEYVDLESIDNEKKRTYNDKHTPFVVCEDKAKKGEKFKVKVIVGDKVKHPDDFDHYIKYVQLWDGETFLAETHFPPGVLGNEANKVEVDFYIVPKRKMKLAAMEYCTKHGLWQSPVKEVEVE